MFESLNKDFSSVFDVSIENGEYYKLSEVALGEVYGVVTMYINPNGKFGEYACLGIVKEGELCWLQLPSHLTDAIKIILSNPEYIKAVNERHLGVAVRKYFSKKYNKDCYTADFKDV